MAFVEVFSEFYNTDDFAVNATYTPQGGSASTITGIFDEEYQLIDAGSVGVSGSTPVFECASSSVPAAAPGDTLVVNAVTFLVVEVQPDGTGVTVLILEKQ